MKKILLVTHHDLSDPGIISSLLHSKYLTCNINYKNLTFLKQSDIKEYAAIIIFGGKMSANSKSRYIKNEYKIREKKEKRKKKKTKTSMNQKWITSLNKNQNQKPKLLLKQRNLLSNSLMTN